MMRQAFTRRLTHTLAMGGLLLMSTHAFAADIELKFYYPVAVGGEVSKIIDDYAATFEHDHPGIKVKPIYAGDYIQTIAKALTAVKGGDAPELAILLAADLMTLTDEDAVIPIDDLIKTDADKAWLNSFYPAFMENAKLKGKTYAIPFQRSTPVLYWNKEMFKAAGLDPERGPKDWAEMREFAKKLTKKGENGAVAQWGIEIPSDGNTLWLFTGMTTGNDVRINNADGTKINVGDPKVVEALQNWYDLSKVDGSQPPGLINWGTTPRDFIEGRTAMIWHTTGNLTNVRKNAKFPFGVAFLPGKVRSGAPTGGGNFYFFKGMSPEKQRAALTFVEWMTSPERAAEWSIKTGYVATQPAAYETPVMKGYTAEFAPAIVARDQLNYAVPEMTVHENQRVTKIINDSIQAVMTGTKTPDAAMKEAQAQGTTVLKEFN